MNQPNEPGAGVGVRFDVASFSEQGPRAENQDATSIDSFSRSGLLALADGMGGQKSGREAADRALQALVEVAPIRSLEEARRAVRSADRAVAGAAEPDPDRLGGMGCALALLSLARRGDAAPGWIAAHVGDVRILSRSPDGVLRLETRDHTPAFARWEAGEIGLDEVPDTAGANRLQRAVGRGGEADVNWLPVAPGWAWLIVSDGVYKSMRLDELARAMAAGTAGDACETIRRKVEERGPEDNYTAVLVRALGAAGGPAPAAGEATEPMSAPSVAAPLRRSAWGGFAAALALAALVLSGLALWTAREARTGGVERVELESLRIEVDSLRALITQLREPFGPTAPPNPAAASPSTPSGP
jgi:serine/threonine protein phosphatase PrpC